MVQKHEPDAPKAGVAGVRRRPRRRGTSPARSARSTTARNAYDPPDFSLDAYRAARLIGGAKRQELLRDADQPWGKADVYFIQKAAMGLE